MTEQWSRLWADKTFCPGGRNGADGERCSEGAEYTVQGLGTVPQLTVLGEVAMRPMRVARCPTRFTFCCGELSEAVVY